MDSQTVIGFIVTLSVIGLVTYAVVWSSRSIDWIAERRLRSARQIIKEFRNGR